MKILALCDSPLTQTGFARVAQNLFRHWTDMNVEVHCWGIMFDGWGYQRIPKVRLFPGGSGSEWASPARLEIFLRLVESEGYDCVWMMQDTFALSRNGFAEALKNVAAKAGTATMLYFPVDSNLDPEWLAIVEAVDVAVAYTEYGVDRAKAAKAQSSKLKAQGNGRETISNLREDIYVLPHGVDTQIYDPGEPFNPSTLQPSPFRLKAREMFKQKDGTPWAGPEDFLMVNVNAHQKRKDVARTLEILAGLKAQSSKLKAQGNDQGGTPNPQPSTLNPQPSYKLIMNMPEMGQNDNTSLRHMGRQLGLIEGEDWMVNDANFKKGHALMTEGDLVRMYRAADLYLTTTLGEGWGLGITEAIACGCPVAVPDHTSCREIVTRLTEFGVKGLHLLPVEAGGVVLPWDNTRYRQRVDLPAAIEIVRGIAAAGSSKFTESRPTLNERPVMTEGAQRWMSWPRVADAMRRLMVEAAKKAKAKVIEARRVEIGAPDRPDGGGPNADQEIGVPATTEVAA